MTPTYEPMLRLLRSDWDRTPWPPAPIGNDIDWTTIVQTALDHGVAGLLCRSLRRLPDRVAPPDIVEAAGIHLADANAEGTALVVQLFAILDVLAADEIPALSFKGPVLGMLAHGSATIRNRAKTICSGQWPTSGRRIMFRAITWIRESASETVSGMSGER